MVGFDDGALDGLLIEIPLYVTHGFRSMDRDQKCEMMMMMMTKRLLLHC